MALLAIIIGGERYPCYATAGAMLRFAEHTGREINQIRPGFTDMVTYLWCTVSAACAREKKEFGMSLQEFADSLRLEDMAEWQEEMNRRAEEEAGDEDGQKKTPQGSTS